MAAAEWAPIDARQDLRPLYRDANQPEALPWQAMRFWHAFFDAWRDFTQKAIATMSQTPADYSHDGEHRLFVGGYSADQKRRHFLAIVEVKSAWDSDARDLRRAEAQLYDTCVGHLGQDGGPGTAMVYAVCAVGTKCRMFRYCRGGDDRVIARTSVDRSRASADSWLPLWALRSSAAAEPAEYIDAADHANGNVIWRALQLMLAKPPTPLAGIDYLKPRFPEPDRQFDWNGYMLSNSQGCYILHCWIAGAEIATYAKWLPGQEWPQIWLSRKRKWYPTVLNEDGNLFLPRDQLVLEKEAGKAAG